MKQGFNEYVKDIAKASEEQEAGKTEKMTIDEGSGVKAGYRKLLCNRCMKNRIK